MAEDPISERLKHREAAGRVSYRDNEAVAAGIFMAGQFRFVESHPLYAKQSATPPQWGLKRSGEEIPAESHPVYIGIPEFGMNGFQKGFPIPKKNEGQQDFPTEIYAETAHLAGCRRLPFGLGARNSEAFSLPYDASAKLQGMLVE